MPLLTGLTADGTEVPVQVEPDGVLVAEGIQGAPGPQGPEGPQGPQGPKGDPGSSGGGLLSVFGYASWNTEITSNGPIALDTSAGLSAERISKGVYRFTFTTPRPNINYFVSQISATPIDRLSVMETDFFEIQTRNNTAALTDPARLQLTVSEIV